MKKRYYLHGDQQEGSDSYYCSACDAFVSLAHFRESKSVTVGAVVLCQPCDHLSYYKRSRRSWRLANKKLYHRPQNAPNYFA